MDERAGEGISKAVTARGPLRVRTLIALVACCGAVAWAVATVREAARPSLRWARVLRSGDVDDRQVAARQLGDSDPGDLEVAVPALVAAMGDGQEPVRAAVAAALGVSGLAALKAKDPRGDAKEAVAALTRALADPGPEVRMEAADALGKLAASSKDLGFPGDPGAVASAMVGMLAEPSVAARKRGEAALVKVASGTAAGPPPALLEGLKSWPLKESRSTAAFVLGSFKSGVGPAVDALIVALKDQEPEVRGGAAAALRRFGGDARRALPGLVATLDDSFVPPPLPPPMLMPPQMQAGGAASAGEAPINEQTDPASQAARAIGRIVGAGVAKGDAPPADVVSALAKALHAGRPALREAAEEAIGQAGKGASAAIPDLIEDLAESTPKADPGHGPAAASALGGIAPGSDRAGQAIDALTSALGAKQASTRRAAARALPGFGPAALAAVPRLRELGADPDQGVSRAASEAADRLEGKAPPERAARKGQGRRGGGGLARP